MLTCNVIDYFLCLQLLEFSHIRISPDYSYIMLGTVMRITVYE